MRLRNLRSAMLGFIGLVTSYLLRLLLGSYHRVLVPDCILFGDAFLAVCEILARALPNQGDMPGAENSASG